MDERRRTSNVERANTERTDVEICSTRARQRREEREEEEIERAEEEEFGGHETHGTHPSLEHRDSTRHTGWQRSPPTPPARQRNRWLPTRTHRTPRCRTPRRRPQRSRGPLQLCSFTNNGHFLVLYNYLYPFVQDQYIITYRHFYKGFAIIQKVLSNLCLHDNHSILFICPLQSQLATFYTAR